MSRPMKQSGVEWIGEIPIDWETKKLKHISSFVRTKYSMDDENLNYIGLENIVGWSGAVTETDSAYELDQSLICEAGDILFGKLRPYLAKVYLNTVKQCCSSEFAVIRMNAPLCPKFFRYQLMSHGFIFKVDSSTYGTKMPRANVEFIKNISVVIPPLDEQKRIAAFLDDKCARIDSVISKTRATVAEYKKLKQAIITRAVTKGIRPNRPTKDSGIEWLGDIPADWKIGRLKNLFILQRGYDLPSEKFVEGDFPIYGSGGLMGYHNQKTSTAPNVVIGRSGSTGKLHYIEKDFWAHNTGIFISDKKGNFCKYLYYLLNVVDMEELSTKTAVPTLDRKKIQEYKLPYTIDIEEQKEIAQYLDEKTAAIDSLVAKKNRLVSELESLKKSLIFEYVTGKKEVPT